MSAYTRQLYGCGNKIGWSTRAQARKAAHHTGGSHPKPGRLEQYLCDYCAKWHNGRPWRKHRERERLALARFNS